MSSLARIAFLQRTRTEQLQAFSRVIHAMQRTLVLKHWHKARKTKSSGPTRAAQPVLSLLEEACIDSTVLVVRTLDAFFAAHPTSVGRIHEKVVCAVHFGYAHAGGFLNKERREELSQHIEHVTLHTEDATFHASLREDLIRSLEPSRKFLQWILSTDFLEGEDALQTEAQTLLTNLQSVVADVFARALRPGTLEMTEDVVKATSACLRAAKSSFSPIFARLIRNAVSSRPASSRRPQAPGSYGTLTFTGGLADLDLLLKALSAIQASLGENSESVRILNWLQLSWSELRRKVVGNASMFRAG